MNRWDSGWLLIVTPLTLLACGNASDAGPKEDEAQAGNTTIVAGLGGAALAGSSGAPSSSGGTSSAGPNGGGGGSLEAGKAATGGSSAGGAGNAEATGAGTGGMSGAGGTSPAAALLDPLVSAFCVAARACCAGPDLTVDLDHCEANVALHDSTFAAINKGTATVDQAGLARCLTAYQQAATKCQELPVLSACQGLVHGTQKEHEPCVDLSECAHADGEAVACLIADQSSNVGVCAKVTHGKAGDSCLDTCEAGEDCSFTSYGASESNTTFCFEQDGLFCSTDTGTCAAITALGAPCMFDDCGSQNYCDTTCKKRSRMGESCSATCLDSLQCIGSQCQSPSFTVGGTCTGNWFGLN